MALRLELAAEGRTTIALTADGQLADEGIIELAARLRPRRKRKKRPGRYDDGSFGNGGTDGEGGDGGPSGEATEEACPCPPTTAKSTGCTS